MSTTEGAHKGVPTNRFTADEFTADEFTADEFTAEEERP
jgi:hypothetical protein